MESKAKFIKNLSTNPYHLFEIISYEVALLRHTKGMFTVISLIGNKGVILIDERGAKFYNPKT